MFSNKSSDRPLYTRRADPNTAPSWGILVPCTFFKSSRRQNCPWFQESFKKVELEDVCCKNVYIKTQMKIIIRRGNLKNTPTRKGQRRCVVYSWAQIAVLLFFSKLYLALATIISSHLTENISKGLCVQTGPFLVTLETDF